MTRFTPFHILFALAALAVAPGCIRDEIPPCPPLRVSIEVKDKNYFNVDQVELEERRPDNLPLREYVPTVFWTLRDLKTGKVMAESEVVAVTGNAESYEPEFSADLPYGEYVMTVWGGLQDKSPLKDDISTIDFHPENVEGSDVYMTNDTLLYDYHHNGYTVELERTKGKLIIEKIGLPEDVTRSEKTIDRVFSSLNTMFRYSGETSVATVTPITPAESVMTKTMLSPSPRRDGSRVSLTFHGSDAATGEAATYRPKDVDISVWRNELTVLRYVWDKAKNDFVIYILVNGNWETISKMEIQ